MPAFDLLRTRRLRREIEQQAQQLQCDIEHEQRAREQFRQTFVKRMTSPLGLSSAVAAGFVAGKIGARPSNANRAAAHAVASAISLAIAATRSVAVQVVLPMAIEWIQSRFANRREEAATKDTQAQDDSIPRNQT